ncbi:MAG: VCBS repeat-containing protein [Candidatus Hydrogenedentes bacterium]|nr:VCBS repeat-containing protein [Candidatus Hydrogenedentota bacterium]
MSGRVVTAMMGSCTVILITVLASVPAWPAPAKTFAMPGRLISVGPNPCAVACRDLNDDGLVDIVTADRGLLADPRDERPANDELSVLIADKPMSFTRLTPTLKTGFGPFALDIANVDGLKWPDIIVASFHAVRHRDITVFLNIKTEGIFRPATFRIADENLGYFRHRDGEGVPVFTKPGLSAVAVRDVTGDGLRDLLATGWSSDVVVFMAGHAEQYFSEPKLINVPGAPRDLCVADFDKDGKLDFAVACQASAEVSLWRGDGHGVFTEKLRFPTRGNLPTTIRAADFNNDGKTDLAVSHSHTEDSIVVFYGDDALTFAVSQEITLGKDRTVLEHEIRDLVVGDFNGNGRPDMAAACFASGEVSVLLNTSKDAGVPQVFVRESYRFSDNRPRALAVADFDNDGKNDLAVALWDANAVGILRNSQ